MVDVAPMAAVDYVLDSAHVINFPALGVCMAQPRSLTVSISVAGLLRD